MCHIQDRDHLVKRCTKPCERYVCIKKHRCPKKCFENCGNCMVKLDKELPCGHVVKLPCYVNELDYKCVVLVEKMLPDCGHIGRVHCAVHPKGHPCSIPCDFRLYCGHSCERKCHVNVSFRCSFLSFFLAFLSFFFVFVFRLLIGSISMHLIFKR